MARLLALILLLLALAGCGAGAPRVPQSAPARSPTAGPEAMPTAAAILAELPAGEGASDMLETLIGVPFEIELGEQIDVGDSGIVVGFAGVPEDSRCPENARCLWQGRAVITIELHAGDQLAQSFSLAIPGDLTPDAPELIAVGGYTLRLIDLAPYPAVPGGSPEPYVATLVLER